MTSGKNSSAWPTVLGVALLLLVGVCMGAGDDDPGSSGASDPVAVAGAAADTTPYVAEVPEEPGVAVAVLLDNSGSMDATAPGDVRPKYLVARQALEQVLLATRERVRARPDVPVKVGIYTFASEVHAVLPIAPYDSAAVERALAAMPPTGGGTAIGDAMDRARADLYRAGAFRKYVLVITDGESNEGAPPEQVAAEIARRSEGAVRMYYVAFDVDPEKFAFIREAGGDVLSAAGGAQLRTALAELYESRILAEAADPGDALPRPARMDTAETERQRP
jgi:Mg-chelatase subunit ChlD